MTERYLGSGHALAQPARDLCRERHANVATSTVRVACGRCWETVIRTDERVVVEHGLPPVPESDPWLVDEVAVTARCRGQRVRLTPYEWQVAVDRLAAEGQAPSAIARRLRVPYARVHALLTRNRQQAAITSAGADDRQEVA